MHGRWRRRLTLLASGVLAGAERDAVLDHVSGCAACREELRACEQVLALVSADPVRHATSPIPAAALVTRIQARLDEPPARAPWWRLLLLPGAAIAAVVVLVALVTRPPTPTPVEAQVSPEVLDRLERTEARQRAVRYLTDAQDVLVTVASAPQLCNRDRRLLGVGEEVRRSRDLLARRTLLVEAVHVTPAAPLLDDVERVLREVAALQSCAHAGELEAIQREIRERRLLMKIDLVTKELAG